MSKDVELKNQALTLKERCTAVVISTPAAYEAAGELLKDLKTMEKTIVEHFKPLKQAIDASKKVVLDQEKAALGPVQEADGILRKTVRAYLDEEDRKAQEEADRQRRANDLAAEKEREKLLNRAANAKTEEKQEELLEKAEMVYAAPVAVEHAVDKTVGGITRKMETVVTLQSIIPFLTALIEKNPGAVPGIIDIKSGPLKAFVKTNGLKTFPGLLITEQAAISVRA